MKTFSSIGLSALILAACSAARGQDSSNGGIVAVLDVAKVFQSNAEFDSQMNGIRSQADSLKSEIQREQDAIRQEAQQLQAMPPTSDQFKQLEATLEQRQTNLRTRAGQSERDLLIKEAKVYFDTYKKMREIVDQISQREGIALVLRFDSSPVDPENRGDVIKAVNRSVVYYYKLDMTDMVIDAMGPRVANQESNAVPRAGTENR